MPAAAAAETPMKKGSRSPAPISARCLALSKKAPVMAGMQRGSEPARVREASKTDTDALLAEAGYGADQIEKLKEDGVIA